jgi:NAD(P)H-dependent FMN reductase
LIYNKRLRFFDIGQLPFFNEDVEAAGDPEPVRRFGDWSGEMIQWKA